MTILNIKRTLLALSISGLSMQVYASNFYEEALVVSSTPIYRTIETQVPQRSCWYEEVARSTRRDNRNAYNSRTPDLLGAVIGGAIGNELGHNKSNQRVGAVVGALLGGSIARDLSRGNNSRRGNNEVRYETVERCETVHSFELEEKLVGYDVLYSYNGQNYSVRMPYAPGSTIQVRVNVEPVL